jgi:hypothetical protein
MTTTERSTILRILSAGLFLFLMVIGTIFGQDFIKENPDFEKMYNSLTPQNREQMLNYLLSMTPENRKAFIGEMVKIDTEVRKNRISVEHVSAKLTPSPGNEPVLTATSFDPKVEPLTAAEIEQLRTLGLHGNLRIEGFSKVSPEESLKWPKVRIILVMQKQIAVPVEFHMPPEGSLFLVQTNDGWKSAPAGYTESNKTVRIEPLPDDPLRTRIDFDIGNGRVGFQVFLWGSER